MYSRPPPSGRRRRHRPRRRPGHQAADGHRRPAALRARGRHAMSSDTRARRVAGALIGSVVGDALGAPFKFRPPGAFSRRSPPPPAASPPRCARAGSGSPASGGTTPRWRCSARVAARARRAGRGRHVRPVPSLGGRRPQGRRHPDLRRAALRPSHATRPPCGSLPPARAASNGSLMRTTPGLMWSVQRILADAETPRRRRADTEMSDTWVSRRGPAPTPCWRLCMIR